MKAFLVLVVVVTVLGGALGSSPAVADEGDSSAEGYVLVQQALSFLVNDSGPEGVARALMKVDQVLAGGDQEGVDVGQIRHARADLLAGDIAQGRALLQESITAALQELRPATGEGTGTSIVLGPLATRGALTGWDWAFLSAFLLMVLGGIVLSVRLRPRESWRELSHEVRPHRALSRTPKRSP